MSRKLDEILRNKFGENYENDKEALKIMYLTLIDERFNPEHEMADTFNFLIEKVVTNEDGTFCKALKHGERWWLKS